MRRLVEGGVPFPHTGGGLRERRLEWSEFLSQLLLALPASFPRGRAPSRVGETRAVGLAAVTEIENLKLSKCDIRLLSKGPRGHPTPLHHLKPPEMMWITPHYTKTPKVLQT